MLTCLFESSENVNQKIKLVIPSDKPFENFLILILLVEVESHGQIQGPKAVTGNQHSLMTSKDFGSNSL